MGRRGLLIVLLLILILSGCTTAGAGKSSIAPTAVIATSAPLPDAAQIDAYLSHSAATRGRTGSVLVAHDGSIFSKGYGPADKDAHIYEYNADHVPHRLRDQAVYRYGDINLAGARQTARAG